MRSNRKPLLAFLASGLLFVLFLLVAFGPLGPDKPRPAELVPPVVRAEDLAAVFAENPTEADCPYLRRELTVAGEWQAIRPVADAPGLLLELKAGAGLRISCYFADADPDHCRELERRVQGMDVVRVRGRCAGRDGDSVVLRECQLVD
jgi:hypothetical protein